MKVTSSVRLLSIYQCFELNVTTNELMVDSNMVCMITSVISSTRIFALTRDFKVSLWIGVLNSQESIVRSF